MPAICLRSITLKGWSERQKSTSAANHSTYQWAFSLAPGASTGRHRSTSAANLLGPCFLPGGLTGKHKSSIPLLCWSGLGRTRTLGVASGRRKSTSVAQLSRPQLSQEALTVRHKPSMPPICWALFNPHLMLRGLTRRHKSTTVAKLLKSWCPQIVPTEKPRPSMPPICWLLCELSLLLRWATLKPKATRAADLLQAWRSPGLSTMQRKFRRANKLLMSVGALCSPFRLRCERRKIPCGSSNALRLAWVAKSNNGPILMLCFMQVDEGSSP